MLLCITNCVVSFVKNKLVSRFCSEKHLVKEKERTLFSLDSGGVWMWGRTWDSLGVMSSWPGDPGLPSRTRQTCLPLEW